MGTYVNPANAITASRYLTLPPFLYYLDQGMPQPMLILVIVCGLLDLADGPAARYFNCSSGFGELFDAVTDGICYSFIIAALTFYGKLPWVPVVIFIGLGGYNALLRIVYTRRAGRTTNFRSWAMERIAAYSGFLGGIGVADFDVYFYSWAIIPVMVVICAWDTKRMLIDPIPDPEPGPESTSRAEAVAA